MPKRPGLFFYRDAWDSEPGLAVCSEGAQYLWFKMLLLMNEQEPRGYLLLNGRAPTPQQIASLTRTDPTQVEARLAELEEAGVFSRDRRRVIYSRRMVREDQKARIARENGKKGGNPSLRKEREISPSDNQGGKGGVIPLNYRLQTQAQDSDSTASNDESGADVGVRAHASARAGPRDARASRIPDDWQPCPKAFAFGNKMGFDDDEIWQLADAFRDYWQAESGARARKCDWLAAFRTWVRRERDRKTSSRNRASGAYRGGTDQHGAFGSGGRIAVTAAVLHARSRRKDGFH